MSKKYFSGSGSFSGFRSSNGTLELEYLKTVIDLVDFAHKKRVDFIVAPESGGRGVAIMFQEFYRKRYPGKKVPTPFFVNFYNIKNKSHLIHSFPDIGRNLQEGKRALILDSCLHSGNTMGMSYSFLNSVSHKKKILTAVIDVSPSNTDFYEPKNPKMHKLDFKGKYLNVHYPFSWSPFKKSSYSPSVYGQLKDRSELHKERVEIKSWADKVLPMKIKRIKKRLKII